MAKKATPRKIHLLRETKQLPGPGDPWNFFWCGAFAVPGYDTFATPESTTETRTYDRATCATCRRAYQASRR